jgi:radical SAM superfamily enzyme YgiQ (UPF0313 family)
MTEVLLVFPGPKVSGMQALAHVRLPYSLLCLAAFLRPHSIDTKIIDMRVDDLGSHGLSGITVVGLSCMTGHQIRYALEAATYLRQRLPDAIFVWGGIHPSLHPEETARHPLVDTVVVGEGEETFLEIVMSHLGGDDKTAIPGTVAMRDGVIVEGGKRPFIDLNKAPFPAYDLINLGRYLNCLDTFDYQTSRGCPFRCGFCYNVRYCGRRWRSKSPEKTVEELERLKEEFGVRSFSFVDDEFFINKRRVEGILDLIIGRQLGFKWTASCRLDLCRKFRPEFLEKLRSSGCRRIYFGGESGSREILKDIAKDITPTDTIEGVENCIRNGIVPIVSFMGGFPGETSKQFDETLDLISTLWEIDPRVTINGIFPFSPYPGTALFDRAKGFGLKVPTSLTGWATWSFQYDPDHPWLVPRQRQRLRVAFYIVRFKYYLKEYNLRNRGSPLRRTAINLLTLPLRLSGSIRWRTRFFACAWEWELWALIAQRSFGFL